MEGVELIVRFAKHLDDARHARLDELIAEIAKVVLETDRFEGEFTVNEPIARGQVCEIRLVARKFEDSEDSEA